MKNCAEIMMNCAGIMISPSERVKRIVLYTGIGNDYVNSKTVLQKINSKGILI